MCADPTGWFTYVVLMDPNWPTTNVHLVVDVPTSTVFLNLGDNVIATLP